MHTLDLNAPLRLHSGEYLVAGHHGSLLKLRNNATGDYMTMHISDVTLNLLEPPTRVPANIRELESLTKKESKKLDIYASHIQEMITGDRPDQPGASPRPEYDPASTTLNERVAAKGDELARMGIPSSRATLMRKKKEFETAGSAALLDRRTVRKESPLDRADSRVIEALTRVIAAQTNESTGTGKRLYELTQNELLTAHPGDAIPMPSLSTFYRYLGYLTKGKYTTGSAPTRRTAANTPKRPFGTARRLRPGQEVQIDSSPWDVLVRREDGTIGRAVLTIMVDVATRSIIASSVRPDAAKGVDHAFLIAQCLVPRKLRPGSDELWRLTARRMPWADLLSAEQRDAVDATRPFIYPERIMMDNGADFRSGVFESACRKFGISLTYAAPHTPTDKAIVERTFHSIKTSFAQDLPGFKGGAVSERGRGIDDKPLMDIATLADKFDEWVARVWQNRPHDSLRDPMFPTVKLTPNEMYNASFDLAASLPLPLTADDYIDLMPREGRMITTKGVQMNNRFYDSIELQPFRNVPSANASENGKWEVRYNPYDPRLIWVAHPDGYWMECTWRDEAMFTQPFADEILSSAVDIATRRNPGDSETLRNVARELKKATHATAVTAKKAKARNELASALADAEGTPMPAAAPAFTEPAKTAIAHKTIVSEAEAAEMLEADEFEMEQF